nr:putative ribonuclease H-like domain-containing protein [Tanacetum cinerariifolium]
MTSIIFVGLGEIMGYFGGVANGETWPKDNYAHKRMTPRAVLLKPGTTPIVETREKLLRPQLVGFGDLNKTLLKKLCREFEALMHNEFQMSAMGKLTFFLSLRVLQKKDGIFLSQDKHQVTPKECQIHAVKRIFRYLKGHPKLGLWYPKESPFDLVAYSDSDYGGATQDRKSTTGGCQFLGR